MFSLCIINVYGLNQVILLPINYFFNSWITIVLIQGRLLFENYSIKATFATVGVLFAKDKEKLAGFMPDKKPAYSNPEYNVYLKEFATKGNNEQDDPYHFGYSLFEMIRQSPHEMATHTFSHRIWCRY